MPSKAHAKSAAKARNERPRTHAEINEFRRNALVEGTIESLSRYGVTGTTVRTICDAAGSSRGLIGHYYESKEELMAAALKHLFGKVSEQVQGALDKAGASGRARLMEFPKVLFSPAIFTERNRTAFLCFWHEIRFNQAVRRANRELYRGYIGRVEVLFRDAVAEIGATIDVHRAAIGLIGLTDGLWLGMSIYDKVVSRDHAVAICQGYVEQALKGRG